MSLIQRKRIPDFLGGTLDKAGGLAPTLAFWLEQMGVLWKATSILEGHFGLLCIGKEASKTGGIHDASHYELQKQSKNLSYYLPCSFMTLKMFLGQSRPIR